MSVSLGDQVFWVSESFSPYHPETPENINSVEVRFGTVVSIHEDRIMVKYGLWGSTLVLPRGRVYESHAEIGHLLRRVTLGDARGQPKA